MIALEHFALRPLESADKDMIRRWRNLDRVRVNMYTDCEISSAEHSRWFARAVSGDSGRYFVLTLQNRPVGFVSFTSIQPAHGRSSWAFYLGEADVPRGSGSVMEFLALDVAFSELKVRKLCCEVFEFNKGVIKLHERFGFVREGALIAHQLKNGRFENVVLLAKFGNGWDREREALKEMFLHGRKTE